MNNDNYIEKGKIITLSGVSGSGKSFIANQLVKNHNFEKIKIYVSRPLRPLEISQMDNGEVPDVIPVVGKYNDGEKTLEEQKELEPKRVEAFLKLKLPITYSNYGNYYGISTEEIDKCIESGKNAVIISSDICVIRDLKNIYKDNCIPCYIHRTIAENEDAFIEMAKARQDSVESAKKRFKTAMNIYERYTQNIELFEYTMLNTDNELKTSQLLERVENIVNKRKFMSYEENRPKIYALIGSPGSGKKELLKIIKTQGILHSLIMPKHSTRSRRDDDGEEIICFGEKNYNMDACDIKYENYGNLYGIDTRELKARLDDGISSSIIVSNISALRQLQEKFPNELVKIYIHGLSKAEYLLKHQDELDNIYVISRLKNYDSADELYREYWMDLDHVIIDNGDTTTLKNQMYNIMKYYEKNRKMDVNIYRGYLKRADKYLKNFNSF